MTASANIKISIPGPLRGHCDGLSEIEVSALSVTDAFEKICSKYPSLKERLYDEKGKLLRYINVFNFTSDDIVLRFQVYMNDPDVTYSVDEAFLAALPK